MDKNVIFDKLKEGLLVPVVRVDKEYDAQNVADVLIDVGIKAIEITMSVDNADKVIYKLVKQYGDKIIIGAGTVLSKESAKLVVGSGAQFVVSPCFLEEVVLYCNEQGILTAPGTATPTEIIRAKNTGADFIKIFPAATLGGPKFIKSVKSVFPDIEFMPTGGVNVDTAVDFIESGASVLGVGSSIVNRKLVADGNFGEIKHRAKVLLEKIAVCRA